MFMLQMETQFDLQWSNDGACTDTQISLSLKAI